MTIEKVYCPVGCVQNISWQRDLSTGGWGIVSVLYSVFLCSLPSGDWNYNCMWLKRRSANILEFMLGESHDFFQFFLLILFLSIMGWKVWRYRWEGWIQTCQMNRWMSNDELDKHSHMKGEFACHLGPYVDRSSSCAQSRRVFPTADRVLPRQVSIRARCSTTGCATMPSSGTWLRGSHKEVSCKVELLATIEGCLLRWRSDLLFVTKKRNCFATRD